MKPSYRIAAALLVAPLISGVLHGVYLGNIRASLFALLFAYPATLVLGVPVMLVFKRRGWLHFWQAALTGAGVGLFSSVLLFFITGLSPTRFLSDPSSPYFAILFSVHGLAIASVLWFLAFRTHDF